MEPISPERTPEKEGRRRCRALYTPPSPARWTFRKRSPRGGMDEDKGVKHVRTVSSSSQQQQQQTLQPPKRHKRKGSLSSKTDTVTLPPTPVKTPRRKRTLQKSEEFVIYNDSQLPIPILDNTPDNPFITRKEVPRSIPERRPLDTKPGEMIYVL